jgi:hypothetical protein
VRLNADATKLRTVPAENSKSRIPPLAAPQTGTRIDRRLFVLQRAIIFVNEFARQNISLSFAELAFHLVALSAIVGWQHPIIALACYRIVISANSWRFLGPPRTPSPSKIIPP